MKIRLVGAEMMNTDLGADRQTDRHDQVNISFSQFYERA